MKRLIVFTEDKGLLEIVRNTMKEETFQTYSYEIPLDKIDFGVNDVVLVDFDYTEIDMKKFVSQIVSKCDNENKIIIYSYNCERRVVADLARRGVDRFIVKPMNRKRFKSMIIDVYIQPNTLENIVTISNSQESVVL